MVPLAIVVGDQVGVFVADIACSRGTAAQGTNAGTSITADTAR